MNKRILIGIYLSTTAVMTSSVAYAQIVPAQVAAENSDAPETIFVTGRRNQTLSSIPNSVTVIGTQELETQFAVDQNITSLLQFSVPGMAGQSTANNLQSPAVLRGRTALILIDGVPQNQLLRSSGYDIETIAPEAIARVEVLRGANAVYGFGSTGGVINFITRRAPDEGYTVMARLRTEFQTSKADPTQEVYAQAGGRFGDVGILLGAGYDARGIAYSANGDPLTNIVSSYGKNTLNLHGTMDWKINSDQRLIFTGNYYKRTDRKGDQVAIATGGDPVEGRLAVSERIDTFFTDYDVIYYGTDPIDVNALPFELVPGVQSFANFTLGYENDDLFGSSVQLTGLYHAFSDQQQFYKYADQITRGDRLRRRWGGRLSVVTPIDAISSGTTFSWGADYIVNTEDEGDVIPPYNLSRQRTTFRSTPYISQKSLGVYGQMEVPVGDFILTGGVRHERIRARLDDAAYTFGGFFDGTDFVFGGFFEGGRVGYESTIFNASVVYKPTPDLDTYVTFSQGIDVTQLGRAAYQVSSASLIDPQAATTNNYEVGLRARLGMASLALAGFYSDSALASRTAPVPGGGFARPIRQPEKIWGIEGSWNWPISDRYAWGGNFTWMKGNRERPDGTSSPIENQFLSPPIINTHIDWMPVDWFEGRAQVFYTFKSAPFPPNFNFGEGAYRSRADLALLARFKSDQWGVLEIGVRNLFNQTYVSPGDLAANLSTSYIAVPGRTVSIGYSKRLDFGQ